LHAPEYSKIPYKLTKKAVDDKASEAKKEQHEFDEYLSVDPIGKDYPWYTPYQFAGNTPIQAVDMDGLEIYYSHIKENADGSRSKLFVVNYANIKNAGNVNVETANGVGPRGDVGVTYVIHKFDKDGKETGTNSFNVKNTEHGVYAVQIPRTTFSNSLNIQRITEKKLVFCCVFSVVRFIFV